jgi:HAE1 family hydrophobic/amphiphilic exporter-1
MAMSFALSAPMHVRLLAALALGCALAASGQTNTSPANTRSLSLTECVQLALSRNLDLQIQQLTTDIARYDLKAAYGVFLPSFSIQARHDSLSAPGNFDVDGFNPDFPYQLETDTITPMLAGTLPIGLSYEFGGNVDRRDARTDFSSDPDNSAPFLWGIRNTNNYFAAGGLTGRQHLLKDFWIDQERLTIVLGRKTLKMSQELLKFQVMRTVLAAELAYYDLIAARETVKAQEKALETSRRFVAEMRRRVEVGDIPALDADQAESEHQNTLTALYAAREALATQQNVLKSLISDDFRRWAEVEFVPTDLLLAIPSEPDRSESFQSALRNRPDLAEARLAIDKSDAVVRFRYNQLFPSLDLIGRYGGVGVDTEATGAIGDVATFRDPQYYYGAVLTIPLSNSKERNAYRASKAARQIAELQLKRAEEGVLLQVADWVNRVQSRYKQVGSSRLARSYAASALAAEEKKLANGLSTTFVVLQLQEALVRASTTELKALADYNKALAQLAFADGTTLERHHLKVETR